MNVRPIRATTAAIDNWGTSSYNHPEWFFDGPHGKWIGYSIGLKLAEQLYKDGFELEKSLSIKPDEAKKYIEQLSI